MKSTSELLTISKLIPGLVFDRIESNDVIIAKTATTSLTHANDLYAELVRKMKAYQSVGLYGYEVPLRIEHISISASQEPDETRSVVHVVEVSGLPFDYI